MFKNAENYYFIEEFKKFGINAVFTKKDAGNMAYEVLDEKENVYENRKKLLTIFAKDNESIFYTKQVHSDDILIIGEDNEPGEYHGYDGFITKRHDAVILMKYADCLPIFFFDKENKVIALVHAGWKGTYAGIQIKTLELMREVYGSKMENILIGLGVGIKSCCYEVGSDLYEKFKEKYDEAVIEKSFVEKEGKIFLDLEDFNYNVLKNFGVKWENIIKSGMCTKCSSEFFSYREEKESSGRNAGLIFFD